MLSDIRTFALDPSGPVGWQVGPLLIRLIPAQILVRLGSREFGDGSHWKSFTRIIQVNKASSSAKNTLLLNVFIKSLQYKQYHESGWTWI